MKRLLTAILLVHLTGVMQSAADLTIGMGPFMVSVPADWSVNKDIGDSKLQASSADSIKIGEAEVPVMVRIETKAKIGTTLEDLQAFLIEKLVDSPDKGEAIIEKGWGAKADRLGVDSLKHSEPKILGEAGSRYLTSTVHSEFDVDGEKLKLISRSYWVYTEETAFFMRIVTPGDLAEQYAEVVDAIAKSVRINKGEQGGAGEPATRSESDSEGADKPKPKSEERPQ